MKKLFSLVALTGMFILMSFDTPTKDEMVETKTYVDCFDQAERISCGDEHCNDGLWDFVYDFCLFMQ